MCESLNQPLKEQWLVILRDENGNVVCQKVIIASSLDGAKNAVNYLGAKNLAVRCASVLSLGSLN